MASICVMDRAVGDGLADGLSEGFVGDATCAAGVSRLVVVPRVELHPSSERAVTAVAALASKATFVLMLMDGAFFVRVNVKT
jgi:hypothetical protein